MMPSVCRLGRAACKSAVVKLIAVVGVALFSGDVREAYLVDMTWAWITEMEKRMDLRR
jgi:hypothetical protein